MTGLFLFTVLTIGGDPAAPTVDYLRDIKPLLRTKCYSCHGAVRQKAGLRLDALPLIRKGTNDGPIVQPGKPAESVLYQAVLGKDHERMPPEGEGEALNAKELALIQAWIEQGVRGPDEAIPEDPKKHWAYQPPLRARPPAPGHPIDAFLDASRRERGIVPLPQTDKATLIRRVTIDLLGVPPTREEVQTFLKDTAPDAYEKLVDRLLASPKYGERWGRHWMDVWRYSDPFGLGEEYRYSQRHIWRWRDWIIDALNADKGYDRMIQEMLAGDELAPADRDTLRATGYLARNWYKFNRNVWLQDTVEYTAAGFLGITLRCARCHEHKYDPLSQEEYYRFRAFFEPHEIRIDPLPGQPDRLKDGIARAFDAKADAPTYVFLRGDERTPDKSRLIQPGVPGVLGPSPTIQAVTFSAKDFAATLAASALAARKGAAAERATAEGNLTRSSENLTAARQRLAQFIAGTAPKEAEQIPFMHDTFASRNADLWKVVSGQWAWENGKLLCKTPSTFATVQSTREHPAALMGRLRFRAIAGNIRSVGFSYDIHGTNFQAVYINVGTDSAVRAFHRINGQDTYPNEGIVAHPVKVGEEITLDFAIRGNLLNTWVNGQLRNVYKLPVARKAGLFSIWAHDAAMEFLEVKLFDLPTTAILADKPGKDRASPVVGTPMKLSREDLEQQVQAAERSVVLAKARLETALAQVDAVEARIQADMARFHEERPESEWKPLAIAAGKAERRLAAFKAAENLLLAEQRIPPNMAKVAAAKKTYTDALAAIAKEEPSYTSLIQIDPLRSTGRRLTLARWITDRQNPLTARVAVNHMWQRHFGTPLVASMANFGLNGKKPTHPQLLDWLAVEFMDAGWSMKRLHRLMVTSRTYCLSSANLDGPAKKADPDNVTYWRANPRRMEGEVVRDSLLAVAGQLDETMGGPIIDEKLGQTHAAAACTSVSIPSIRCSSSTSSTRRARPSVSSGL